MDIKHIRRLVAKRLDDVIDTLQDLRSDIKSFEENETWLADGLEIALENVSQLAVAADTGDFSELIAEVVSSPSDDDEEEEDITTKLDDDLDSDTEEELDFGESETSDDD